jgi:hypothetical protein
MDKNLLVVAAGSFECVSEDGKPFLVRLGPFGNTVAARFQHAGKHGTLKTCRHILSGRSSRSPHPSMK